MRQNDKIEKWLEDDSFTDYMQKHTIEIFNYILNNYPYDPKYEELDEYFDRDDRYVVPLVDYLVYRLHLAKLKRNSKKRREGIWWVFVQVILLGEYVECFAEEFNRLLPELRITIIPMLIRNMSGQRITKYNNMVIKNLENKIKLVGIICTAFLIGCIIISVSSIWTARTMVTDAQKKVYVLDGNVPILVNRTTMDETLDVEARSHVEMFHHYFFTLAPDDKYIRYTMEKAMYLVDETGLAQYNTLKEKGFYSNILGTSAVFSIFCDSIAFNKEKMEFTYYGRQRIERRSSILMRELVTAGQLKRVPRTDNNPHGLLITNWRTLLNKDIEQKTKINY